MIEGKLVKLRALEEDDLSTLREWRNKQHVRKTTREFRLLDMINQKNWFESMHNNYPPREIMFGVLNKKNRLIGVTGLTYIDWKNRHAEVSIYLSSENWQKTSEGRDTLDLIIGYGFGELNLHRLWAEIFSLAKENMELFEKMKFVKEGTSREKLWRNGKWWNSFLYSKLSTEYTNEKKN
jgi:RimJ/RimL family protein N-acetyltransferase